MRGEYLSLCGQYINYSLGELLSREELKGCVEQGRK